VMAAAAAVRHKWVLVPAAGLVPVLGSNLWLVVPVLVLGVRHKTVPAVEQVLVAESSL